MSPRVTPQLVHALARALAAVERAHALARAMVQNGSNRLTSPTRDHEGTAADGALSAEGTDAHGASRA